MKDRRAIPPVLPFLVSRERKGSLISQIVSGVERAVAAGTLKAGCVLPSQEEIAAELGVSLRVVRIACGRLADAGVIRARPHLGSVVLPRKNKGWRGTVLVVMTSVNEASYYQSTLLGELRRRLAVDRYNVVSVTGTRKANGVYDFRSLDSALGGDYDFAFLMSDADLAADRIRSARLPFAAFARKDGSRVESARFTVTCDLTRAFADLIADVRRKGVSSVEIVDFERSGCEELMTGLRKAGISVREWVIPVESGVITLEKVKKAAMDAFCERFGSSDGEPPGLFVFSDDFVANGALLALAFCGVAVPDDVRVVTLSSKGNAPIYPKRIGFLEYDPVAYGRLVAERVLACLATGKSQGSLVLSPVYKP